MLTLCQPVRDSLKLLDSQEALPSFSYNLCNQHSNPRLYIYEIASLFHLFQRNNYLYLLLFYFGGYLFYIFFRQNNIEIDLKNVLILLCFLTIAESLAINTIILPSDLPNWPLNAEDTILYGHTSRGGYQFSSFYYIRPTGFGGNPSITSTLLISILVYLHLSLIHI